MRRCSKAMSQLNLFHSWSSRLTTFLDTSFSSMSFQLFLNLPPSLHVLRNTLITLHGSPTFLHVLFNLSFLYPLFPPSWHWSYSVAQRRIIALRSSSSDVKESTNELWRGSLRWGNVKRNITHCQSLSMLPPLQWPLADLLFMVSCPGFCSGFSD